MVNTLTENRNTCKINVNTQSNKKTYLLTASPPMSLYLRDSHWAIAHRPRVTTFSAYNWIRQDKECEFQHLNMHDFYREDATNFICNNICMNSYCCTKIGEITEVVKRRRRRRRIRRNRIESFRKFHLVCWELW